MSFTEAQMTRYARHIILDEVGGAGQSKLLAARVLVVGAGGLGAPLIQYLAAAGIGTLGIIDDDDIDLSNLQRQVIHRTDRIGTAKVDSAVAAAAAINPEVRVIPHHQRLDAANAAALISGYDLVADGSDNFATRYLLNDSCYFAAKTLISAALLRFDGQLSVFKAHLGGDNPCYRCLFPERPPEGLVPSCAEGGVLGALAGAMGSLQATEVLKEILGVGDSLSGSFVMFDALATTFRKIRLRPDPECALCGDSPSITDLSGHAG